MKHKNAITFLAATTALMSAVAASIGIFSSGGPGPFNYLSIRGQSIRIYGEGIYKHMSADVAIQGIAQDYVTLLIAIPVLIVSLILARKGSIRPRFVLAGTQGYFLVTYLFYTCMGMYNALFLIYVGLMSISFFNLILIINTFKPSSTIIQSKLPIHIKMCGIFLISNAIAIGFLWLGMIIKPILDGSFYPAELNHYTTLIVQGLDLGLLLPAAFISGWILLKRMTWGYISSTVYLIFLSFMMTALTAKIIAMATAGVNVIPVVFVIPTFNLIALSCSLILIRKSGMISLPE